VRKYGRRFTGQGAIFEVLSEKNRCQRLGITVSKKFGDAHLRNLFKRRAREAFRLQQTELPLGISLNVSPRQEGVVPTLQQFLDDLKHVKP
jgi:ribonuclease P protein component